MNFWRMASMSLRAAAGCSSSSAPSRTRPATTSSASLPPLPRSRPRAGRDRGERRARGAPGGRHRAGAVPDRGPARLPHRRYLGTARGYGSRRVLAAAEPALRPRRLRRRDRLATGPAWVAGARVERLGLVELGPVQAAGLEPVLRVARRLGQLVGPDRRDREAGAELGERLVLGAVVGVVDLDRDAVGADRRCQLVEVVARGDPRLQRAARGTPRARAGRRT